jgi:hypothetical protein
MSEIAGLALIEISGGDAVVRLEPVQFLETLRFSHPAISSGRSS